MDSTQSCSSSSPPPRPVFRLPRPKPLENRASNCPSAAIGSHSAQARSSNGHQPYGKAGLLVADIDIDAATGFLAARYKSSESP